METLKRTKVKELLDSTAFGSTVTVKGWVRTFRNNQFIAINDGSTINNIDIIARLAFWLSIGFIVYSLLIRFKILKK
jgi:aspartyl/asparaginyl-tRNA synthetase